MLEINEKFVDRVKQSIIILKNNVLQITLPMIVFNLVFLVLIPRVLLHTLPIVEMFSWDVTQKIWIYMSFWLALWGLYLLAFLFILIPVQISVVKSIKDCLEGRIIDMKFNINYWFKSIAKIFKTYWYMFVYVYLIPAALFIVGWCMFIWWNFLSDNPIGIASVIWSIIMWISLIVFVVFAIYRGTKATFWIIAAIDKQEYTKDNLHKSIKLSDGKWWRVFWNLFWMGFIIGAILQLLEFVWSIFLAFSYDWTELLSASQSDDVDIQELISQFTAFQPISFINNVLQVGFWSILWTLIVIFSYLLFKRLEQEAKEIPVIKTSINNEL